MHFDMKSYLKSTCNHTAKYGHIDEESWASQQIH